MYVVAVVVKKVPLPPSIPHARADALEPVDSAVISDVEIVLRSFEGYGRDPD